MADVGVAYRISVFYKEVTQSQQIFATITWSQAVFGQLQL